jgi:hypothetical protein
MATTLQRHLRLGVLLFCLSPIVLGSVGRFVPFTAEAPFGPGAGIGETLLDGNALTDGSHPYAPRYVIRAAPGRSFSYYVTVRNSSLVTVRILGAPDPSYAALPDSRLSDLRVLVDPNAGADADNLVPFELLELPSSGTVTLLVEGKVGPCADPSAKVEARPDTLDDPEGPREAVTEYVPVVYLTYEVVGFHGVEAVHLPFEVFEPTRPGCGEP